jgi:hypothetical protein
MPRSTKSRRRNAGLDTTSESMEMTSFTKNKPETDEGTDVRDDLPFTIDITPAEEGFKPDRSPAGRKRIPSPFEPLLPDYKGKGWQNQPHDGNVVPESVGEDGTPKYNTTSSVKDSNARVILRELAKAVKFLNTPDGGKLNLGLDVNVTDTLVQFNVRDKQNRKPRSAPGGGDISDGEENSDADSENSTGEE